MHLDKLHFDLSAWQFKILVTLEMNSIHMLSHYLGCNVVTLAKYHGKSCAKTVNKQNLLNFYIIML